MTISSSETDTVRVMLFAGALLCITLITLLFGTSHASAGDATKNLSGCYDLPRYPLEPGDHMHTLVDHYNSRSCSGPGQSPGEAWSEWDENGYCTGWVKNTGTQCGCHHVQSGWVTGDNSIIYVDGHGVGMGIDAVYGADCPPPCSPLNGQACTSGVNACGMPGTGTYNCNGQCVNVVLPSDSHCPVGTFDFLDCSVAAGTAKDPDYAGPATVRVFKSAPPGFGGSAVGIDAKASTLSPYSWLWAVPPSLRDARSYPLYAYVRNVDANGNADPAWPWVPIPVYGFFRTTPACNDPPVVTVSATCSSATGSVYDLSLLGWNFVGRPVPVSVYDGDPRVGGKHVAGVLLDHTLQYTAMFPAFTDGAMHTLFVKVRNVPDDSPPMEPVASLPVACTASKPTNVVITRSDFCEPDPHYTVSWTTLTTPQTDFQVQIATDSGFNDIVVDSKRASAKIWLSRFLQWLGFGSEASADTFGMYQIPMQRLSYGATYFVRVQVKGTSGLWSGWTVAPKITTPVMAYPSVRFSWAPENVFAKQPIQFTDSSSSSPTKWEWDFGDGSPIVQEQNPVHTFALEGTYTVSLRVTNAAGVCLSSPAQGRLKSGKPIPDYQEVRPGR